MTTCSRSLPLHASASALYDYKILELKKLLTVTRKSMFPNIIKLKLRFTNPYLISLFNVNPLRAEHSQ